MPLFTKKSGAKKGSAKNGKAKAKAKAKAKKGNPFAKKGGRRRKR